MYFPFNTDNYRLSWVWYVHFNQWVNVNRLPAHEPFFCYKIILKILDIIKSGHLSDVESRY